MPITSPPQKKWTVATNIFNYNTVTDEYKFKAHFFHFKTLGLGIYHELFFSVWISKKQWSLIGDWPLGEPMSG